MKQYAIVDIETTGGSAQNDRITEIAIVHHDGTQVTDQYATLINPMRTIPYHIIGLTGITNEMVANAPRFYEVAADIIKWTEGRIFVAHNAHFDYGFLKEEFRSLGYTFTRHLLDTVKLARLAFPGYRSYSLGNLIAALDIPVTDRHRALADAVATAQLFTMIMESGAYEGTVNNFIAMGIRTVHLPKSITLEDILNLPASNGVYYFRNQQDTLIYVGKSKNLKSRIARHFSDQTAKSTKIRQSTHSFDYVETGNELAALIRESIEIRSLQPLYNKAQRTPSFPYALIVNEESDKPDFEIILSKNLPDSQRVIRYFTHKRLALSYLQQLLRQMEVYFDEMDSTDAPMGLVNQLLGLDAHPTAEARAAYNGWWHEYVNKIARWFDEDFVLLENGIAQNEHCIFVVHNGRFYGYSYIAKDITLRHKDDILEMINPVSYHPDLDLILHQYIRKNEHKIKKIKL